MSTPDEEAVRAADDAVLAAAETLAEKATPGPWRVIVSKGEDCDTSAMFYEVCTRSGFHVLGNRNGEYDARFAAAARMSWPKAVAIARRALRENREAEAKLARVLAVCDDHAKRHPDPRQPCDWHCPQTVIEAVRAAIAETALARATATTEGAE